MPAISVQTWQAVAVMYYSSVQHVPFARFLCRRIDDFSQTGLPKVTTGMGTPTGGGDTRLVFTVTHQVGTSTGFCYHAIS